MREAEIVSRKLVVAISIIIVIIAATSINAVINLGISKITVSGAWALYPMMVKWAEEYQKTHSDVKLEISAGGAGKGMTDALSGLVDIGMVSREVYPEEIDQGAFWVSVAKDGVIPTLSKDNPVLHDILAKGVNRTTFVSIFVYSNISTWGQVVNKPEITAEIHTYVRSDSCGAAETWAKYLGTKQESLNGIGVYGDPGLADAVKSDPLGIGFNNVNYAYDANSGVPLEGLAIAPVDFNENNLVDESESVYDTRDEIINAIATGAYPSPPARELNLVGKEEFAGEVKDFVTWILTDGQRYALETGYVPLSQERTAEELMKLD
jgi:phosphate transport system substrate-binding protein